MKKIPVIIIILFILFGGAGYFGMRIFIEKKTEGIRADVQDLKLRLQKIEEESKLAPLQPDADVQKVIQTVNSIYHKVDSLEDFFRKNTSQMEETIKKQQTSIDESFKKQAEDLEKTDKEIKSSIQKIVFDSAMANIRSHILKAREDLQYRNVGTAKAELDLVSEAFEKVKNSATEEDKKAIEEMQGILKKARAELDINLPAAANMIDLLWHEMSKLMRKG
ncbi:MAG: hypothetical protein IBX72_03740 [Nitrospirae bacterium]|jgi:type I site-specific restriction endonuclease|nr:hypothetical protein [Nitrospirota bacterium]